VLKRIVKNKETNKWLALEVVDFFFYSSILPGEISIINAVLQGKYSSF